MTKAALIYRDQIMRAVLGVRPAMQAQPFDAAALDRICQRLVDDEEAAGILWAKGHGAPGESLTAIARSLPVAKPGRS